MTWLRQHAKILLVVYSLLLAVAVFSPTSDHQSAAVNWLVHLLRHLGVPHSLVNFTRLEVLMNAFIVAPVSFLGSFIRPRYSWRDWTALGFTVALTVETVQLLLLPERHASFSDIVANTAGALLGALVAGVCRRLLPARAG